MLTRAVESGSKRLLDWLKVGLSGSTFSEVLEFPWHQGEGRCQKPSEAGWHVGVDLSCVPCHPLLHLVPRAGSEDAPC